MRRLAMIVRKPSRYARIREWKRLAVYWKPFEAHAVERVLTDHPRGHVIAFGAGHSVYEDTAQFQHVQRLLERFPQVILLLPTADIEESARILTTRIKAKEPELSDAFLERITEINHSFIEHPSNRRLAKRTVYTYRKLPAE